MPERAAPKTRAAFLTMMLFFFGLLRTGPSSGTAVQVTVGSGHALQEGDHRPVRLLGAPDCEVCPLLGSFQPPGGAHVEVRYALVLQSLRSPDGVLVVAVPPVYEGVSV